MNIIVKMVILLGIIYTNMYLITEFLTWYIPFVVSKFGVFALK